jgi:DNA-binding MarR family transcriptional regulator
VGPLPREAAAMSTDPSSLIGTWLREESIGHLLRVSWSTTRERTLAALAENGFENFGAQQMQVLLAALPPVGRPFEVAKRSRMSRQALNYLLGSLEDAGYVRTAKESMRDGHRLVLLTDRGMDAAQVVVRSAKEWENELRSGLGDAAFDQFRLTLRTIAATPPDDQ